MDDKDEEILTSLNKSIAAACEKRTDFLNSKMAEYAKVKIGENMYHLETGQFLGHVSGYYRYHANDMRFDSSLSIDYRFKGGSNTSSQGLNKYVIGTSDDLIEAKQIELDNLREE